jgi:hypothetical protein
MANGDMPMYQLTMVFEAASIGVVKASATKIIEDMVCRKVEIVLLPPTDSVG